jgi:hypothetical protein
LLGYSTGVEGGRGECINETFQRIEAKEMIQDKMSKAKGISFMSN